MSIDGETLNETYIYNNFIPILHTISNADEDDDINTLPYTIESINHAQHSASKKTLSKNAYTDIDIKKVIRKIEAATLLLQEDMACLYLYIWKEGIISKALGSSPAWYCHFSILKQLTVWMATQGIQ